VLFVSRDDLPEETKNRLRAEAARLGVQPSFWTRGDNEDLLAFFAGWAALRGQYERCPPLGFFFSPKDVEYAVGWDRFDRAISTGKVKQRNAIMGKVGNVRLHDLSGWAAKASLKKFAGAFGIEMSEKTTMDDYKANMYRGLIERPEDFLRYAVEDALVLLELYDRFTNFFRGVRRDVLGLPDPERDRLPPTTGRLVADLLRDWMYHRAGEHADAVRFCDRKLGYLDPDADHYADAKKLRTELVARINSPEGLAAHAATADGAGELKKFFRAGYLHTALGGASVKWFASRAAEESSAFNALVHGGRCNNERPDQYQTGPGLDIDIEGCYGSALKELTLPIGLPTTWSYKPNEALPTLGAWLDANRGELVPGLWTCTASGALPFEQDLLYSKLVKRMAISQADERNADVSTDLVLLRREVKNAIITADILEAVEKVATNRELAALRRLRVVTAVAYRASDRVPGPAEWTRAVLTWTDRARVVRVKPGVRKDDRPRTWYGVPLREFIGPLVDERKKAKAKGNTTYGSLCSRFFPISNTVVSNVITARARLGVWMLAKALGLRQTITDGGIYEPSAVPTFDARRSRPGLETLSRPWEWRNPDRGRRFVPLAGVSYDPDGTTAPTVPDEANDAALAHVRAFWEPYGLSFAFGVDHKRAFLRAAYWSKSDYALSLDPTPGAPLHYALRGKENRKAQLTDGIVHPTFALLRNIIEGRDDFPEVMAYTVGGILKIGKYRAAQRSVGGYVGIKRLRPGDNIPPSVRRAFFNNTWMPLPDEVTYQRRRNRRRIDHGREVEFFEKLRAEGIGAVHRAMTWDLF
jgi:hypothetical protein